MPSKLKSFWHAVSSTFLGPMPDTSTAITDDLLDSDAPVRRFGYWVIAVVFGGFGVWSFLAPIESAALGTGTVQVEGNRKPVQHLEGGIVREILVSNGDLVHIGDPLIRLDSTEASSEKKIIEGRYWAKRAMVDRLLSERDLSQSVTFTSWLMMESDERAQTAILNEQALFAARSADLRGETEVLRQRVSQLQSQISGTSAIVEAKENVVSSMSSELADLRELLKDGYVDKQRILQLERSLAQTIGEIAELTAKNASAKVAIEEAQLQIVQLTKRFTMQVIDLLTKSQEELYDLEQRLLTMADRLARTTVTSPSNGVVMALLPNSLGAVVGAGQELMAIVPDTTALVIDTRLSPMDRDRLFIGQEAEVKFAVFKDAYTITGELTKISADSMLDNQTGESYYEAKVTLFEDDLKLLGEYELVPGMPAVVLVKTGTRSLMGYLTSPLRRMFERSLIED